MIPRDLARRLGAELVPAGCRVELLQTGLLRSGPRSRWMRFDARQSIRLDRAGFVWVARTGPWRAITVRDELENDTSSGSVRLLDVVPLAKAASSPALTKADLMRYLAELPWAPDAILSNDQLEWTELGDARLRVAARCANVEAAVTFTLNADGLIAAIEAPDRPRREGAEFKERPWRGAFRDYRVVDGRTIPFAGEVAWQVGDETSSVWQGRLQRWGVVSPGSAVAPAS